MTLLLGATNFVIGDWEVSYGCKLYFVRDFPIFGLRDALFLDVLHFAQRVRSMV